MAEDYAFGAVQTYDRCPEGDQCAHCKADRPAIPVDAGGPRELSGGVWELDEALRQAMPPSYHRPEWHDTGRPAGWFCACCWTDDGVVQQWPCDVALRHGNYVARAMRLEFAAAEKAGPPA